MPTARKNAVRVGSRRENEKAGVRAAPIATKERCQAV